jgi:hypothetical protein
MTSINLLCDELSLRKLKKSDLSFMQSNNYVTLIRSSYVTFSVSSTPRIQILIEIRYTFPEMKQRYRETESTTDTSSHYPFILCTSSNSACHDRFLSLLTNSLFVLILSFIRGCIISAVEKVSLNKITNIKEQLSQKMNNLAVPISVHSRLMGRQASFCNQFLTVNVTVTSNKLPNRRALEALYGNCGMNGDH